VTADPTRAGTAYAVWDQLVGPVDNPAVLVHNFFSFTGTSYFAKTTDGGVTWGPSKIIVPMRQNQQSIANVIVVAPNGTLYDFFTLITGTGPNTGPQSTARTASRSPSSSRPTAARRGRRRTSSTRWTP
jgi:hypothetical protein